MSEGTYGKLAERFPAEAHKTRKQGGQDLVYVTGEMVISRLNEALGVTGWSWRVVREGMTDVEAWVLGELTATIDGKTITRQHYGNQDVKRGQHGVADLFKAANTDAIKKAATTIGVALYLYDEDERREVQAEMREQARNGNRPQPAKPAPEPTPIQKARAAAELTGAPAPDDGRADAVAKCQKVMRMALAAGLDFEQRDPTRMSTQDVQDYGKALADLIRAARQAAS